jgi:hypothetical protein
MWIAAVILLLLILIAVLLSSSYARPDLNLVPTDRIASPLREPKAVPEDTTMPPRFSTGFGQPSKPLNDKPEKIKQWSPSMESYYQPARDCVPVDFPVTRLQDCPPVKPMSSALPIANMPMCALRA